MCLHHLQQTRARAIMVSNWELRYRPDRRLTSDQKLKIGCLVEQNCDDFGAHFENTSDNSDVGIVRWHAAPNTRAEARFLKIPDILQLKGVLVDTAQINRASQPWNWKRRRMGSMKDVNILLFAGTLRCPGMKMPVDRLCCGTGILQVVNYLRPITSIGLIFLH